MPTQFVPFDDGLADLGPLSDLRASFEQRAGGLSAFERCTLAGAVPEVAVPAARAALVAERLGVPANGTSEGAILVNGRLHGPMTGAARVSIESLAPGCALVASDGAVLALRPHAGGSGAAVRAVAEGRVADFAASLTAIPSDLFAWSRPWHLLDGARFGAAIAGDVALAVDGWHAAWLEAVPAHAARVGEHALHVHPTAKVGVGVVFDCSHGPVFVDAHAEVRHGTVINGPAFIGARCIVAERTLVKPFAAFGPQCRIAGEVGSAIFQACSNKAHDGHLGDALVGEWVNLGAGTVNSNLLNTYGEVVMRLRPEGALERTGRQFMGCVLGDHAKLAIGTRIMTGSSVGTGAMWAAGRAISGAVGPFAWVTDDGERRFLLRKFMEVARTVMARRAVSPGAAYVARLEALHGPD
jgi:UDP-N-acetylglucosamine diphosphorylase/glucosamine-1-phosphate N-acetyltransferase